MEVLRRLMAHEKYPQQVHENERYKTVGGSLVETYFRHI